MFSLDAADLSTRARSLRAILLNTIGFFCGSRFCDTLLLLFLYYHLDATCLGHNTFTKGIFLKIDSLFSIQLRQLALSLLRNESLRFSSLEGQANRVLLDMPSFIPNL